ncbi:Protein FAR-RED IMPAIRED RESPONSE 1, partial [Mucuna pruriens]
MNVDKQITNVFWTNIKMVLDYEYFGDVISLNIMSLALLFGFNHYMDIMIFGASLLYDETT